MKNACVLWTGGKDSMLALIHARKHYDVVCLATFVAKPEKPFLAHPMSIAKAQAKALGIEHRSLSISEPMLDSYEEAIDSLASNGIEVLVTGDMDRVDGHDNWIVERARDAVEVYLPLWNADRKKLLSNLITEHRVRAVCTLTRTDAFTDCIVGRELDENLVSELCVRHGKDGFDACGENGEYHTAVLDGPGFAYGLCLRETRIESTGPYRHLVFDAIDEANSKK